MTNGDLDALKALIREELAPVRGNVEAIGAVSKGTRIEGSPCS